MGNHDQIERIEELHVLEDEVSLSFHSQLIGQMKHQYSTGRVKHTLNVSGMVRARNCPKKKKSVGKYRQ